jgi:hypothetical protein
MNEEQHYSAIAYKQLLLTQFYSNFLAVSLLFSSALRLREVLSNTILFIPFDTDTVNGHEVYPYQFTNYLAHTMTSESVIDIPQKSFSKFSPNGSSNDTPLSSHSCSLSFIQKSTTNRLSSLNPPSTQSSYHSKTSNPRGNSSILPHSTYDPQYFPDPTLTQDGSRSTPAMGEIEDNESTTYASKNMVSNDPES